MPELPRIISVDDHIIEPPNTWVDRLPTAYRDKGPRVERKRLGRVDRTGNGVRIVEDPAGTWCDVWFYEDMVVPMTAGITSVGAIRKYVHSTPVTYDDILPGCFEQKGRLADMDLNHMEASICFPQLPGFCGQNFMGRKDQELALLCVRAYNDYMIDEWSAGDGYGRLIPLTLIPLWDAVLAAQEVRRCADKGSHAVTFPSRPVEFGLPSLYSESWHPFFQACDETDTVINMHVGSGGGARPAPGTPVMVVAAMNFNGLAAALVDWLSGGLPVKYPNLRLALSEGQVGWMPYLLERLDSLWERGRIYETDMRSRIPERPSSYVKGRIYACIYDDTVGLKNRESVGMSQILFEIDYPHADTTYPHSKQVAEKLVTAAGLSEHESWQLLRGNAIECFRLERYGITE